MYIQAVRELGRANGVSGFLDVVQAEHMNHERLFGIFHWASLTHLGMLLICDFNTG